MLTIVIPVRENPKTVDEFIKNNGFLSKYKVVVVDSGGGAKLKPYATAYLKPEKPLPFWEARKLGYSHVSTPYTLNLDSDAIITDNYISSAIKTLEKSEKTAAVSIFFKGIVHRGVLPFGVSIWKTPILRKLYDYDRKKQPKYYCECLYMWEKLESCGYLLETLPYRAKHSN